MKEQWETGIETVGRTKTFYVKTGRTSIYVNRGIGMTDAEMIAMIKLIAAAPELLAACRESLKVMSEISNINTENRAGWAHKSLQTAIIKAVLSD